MYNCTQVIKKTCNSIQVNSKVYYIEAFESCLENIHGMIDIVLKAKIKSILKNFQWALLFSTENHIFLKINLDLKLGHVMIYYTYYLGIFKSMYIVEFRVCHASKSQITPYQNIRDKRAKVNAAYQYRTSPPKFFL